MITIIIFKTMITIIIYKDFFHLSVNDKVWLFCVLQFIRKTKAVIWITTETNQFLSHAN